MEDKTKICITAILSVTGLQCVAWYMGFNGQVFALTSFVIGGIVGKALDIKNPFKSNSTN